MVLTDVLMPETDSLEVIRALRQRQPRLWIVAMSGGGSYFPTKSMLDLAEKCSANRMLSKPFRKIE